MINLGSGNVGFAEYEMCALCMMELAKVHIAPSEVDAVKAALEKMKGSM